MAAAVRRRETCRLCGGGSLEMVLSLAPTPPANAFVREDLLVEAQATFPLDLYYCAYCHHVQLLDVVDPAVLFENYVYVSGTSPVFVAHLHGQAEAVAGRFGLAKGDLVVEIGSNDGTLLRAFQDRGLAVLGIDPARDIAAHASEAGIETWPRFFTLELAAEIVRDRGPARAVIANNVFAHADDLKGFVAGIRELLRLDGVFVFEVSYLLDVYEKTLFDTIYHEHLAYHTVAPLQRFFAAHGLDLFDAERVAAHGGSLRGFVQRAGGPHQPRPRVETLIAAETAAGLDRAETYQAFAGRIDALGEELRSLLQGLKAEGHAIAGFGAPAKATTLMYHFALGPDVLDFIVDNAPLKQGLYTPGLHVPVVGPAAIEERRPNYLLVLAWNFAESIVANNQVYIDAGGRFIVPLPEVKVL